MGAIEIDKITRHYQALCQLVPLKPITRKADYEAAIDHLNRLLDAGGANQAHPLAGLVELLGEVIHSYEKRRVPMPEATPGEVLRYLMEERGLKQVDLKNELGGQGIVSEILNGKRKINIRQAKKLASRFSVSPAMFI
jgi:HTH-type transcriptional regulator/antitoxin HigA